MIRNYIKIAFRNFWRHKVFTLINIIGLSIGISAALVIYLIVHFDFSFNKFNPDGDRIYRVVTNYSYQGNQSYNSGVCGPLPEAVRTQVTGLASSTPFYTLYQPTVLIPAKENAPAKFKNVDNVVLADQRYFHLFNYNWLAGSSVNALNAPNMVVLTSDQAQTYFPQLSYNQMIGKIVNYDTIKTTVAGIVQPIQGNTDFTFHDFISYSTINTNKSLKDQLQLTEWQSTNSASQLFIKLSAQTAVARIEDQLNAIRKKNTKPEDKGNSTVFHLQKLNDLHFNAQYGSFDVGTVVNKTTLYGLLGIAAFLLLLGCINFINLTTAQAAQRAKEIGIRKTMGSNRKQLIIQFLSETFFITLIAVIVSIGLTPLILKLFADFIPAGVKADFLHQPHLILFLICLTIGVSLLSGFYPAIMLSAYKPVLVLKNQAFSNTSQTRNAWLRKSLTVTQFVVAQFFIMSTLLISKQIYYALHKDLGFKKDAIIIINTPWKNRQVSRNQVFMNMLQSNPQVELVSVGGAAPSSGGTNGTDAVYKDGKKEIKTQVEQKFGDENYIRIYHIKLSAGRNFQPGDSVKSLIINTTFAKTLGFNNPSEAVGHLLNYGDGKKREIIGVAADFYQKSLRTPIKPLAILMPVKTYQTGTFHIALKPETANGNEWKAAIASMERSWKDIYPDDDFEYHFFDENIAKFYENEQHTSTLLKWATGLSVLISCLGLLGLAIYTTNQRTKEIGVRKVLGASVVQIVTLLSTEMIWLIVLAFAVVTPIAWWTMNKWMQNFVDRTPISWWIFVLSGGGMLLTALIISSFQTVKAAAANPVNSLRSE